jgi:ArsR family transcriptional regulator
MIKPLQVQCEICKIFSNQYRLKILIALKNKPKTVSQIINEVKVSQSVVSQHLSMIKARGVLEINRKGSFIYYKVKYPEIISALDIMKKVTQKINGE